jgi:hypothetical protein
MAVRRDVFDRCGPFVEIKRGADSLFVHRVIEEYSCDAVIFVPEACIRHLEITNVWKWLQKRVIYGRSNQQNHRRLSRAARPLTQAEAAAILDRVVRRNGNSRAQAMCLVTLLSLGAVCYRVGRLSARTTGLAGRFRRAGAAAARAR